MLQTATWLVDFLGMALALWLAAYLFSRGFRSAVSRWAGLILFLIACAFLIGLYQQFSGRSDCQRFTRHR